MFCIIYENNVVEKKMGELVTSHFPIELKITVREQAIHDWIELIVMKDIAISSVENETFRSFSKHNEKISRRTISQIIIKLNDIVEKNCY